MQRNRTTGAIGELSAGGNVIKMRMGYKHPGQSPFVHRERMLDTPGFVSRIDCRRLSGEDVRNQIAIGLERPDAQSHYFSPCWFRCGFSAHDQSLIFPLAEGRPRREFPPSEFINRNPKPKRIPNVER
jgi:hypothetical protein